MIQFGLDAPLPEPEEALDHLLSNEDVWFESYADAFIDRGFDDHARQLVAEALVDGGSGQQRRARQWLIDFHAERDQTEDAFEYARHDFMANPSRSTLARACELASGLQLDDSVVEEMREHLRQQAPAELVRLQLEEGRHDEALETWRTDYDRGRGMSLELDIADAVRESHPDVAIDFWAEAADGLIARRGRGNYKTAAKYFGNIRDVYEQTEREGQWNDLAKWLFEEHNRLPAFKDEMRKAGLAPDES